MPRTPKPAGLSEEQSPWNNQQPIHFSVVVKDAGRILLPADVRDALGVAEGDTLQGFVEDGELHLLTSATALRQIQEYLATVIPPEVNVVDDFIAERRAEAAREEAEAQAYLASMGKT